MLLSLLLCTVVFMNSLSVLTGDNYVTDVTYNVYRSRRFFRSSIVATGAKKKKRVMLVIPHSSTHFCIE